MTPDPQALARWQADLEAATSSPQILDLLLSPADAADRVATLPGETVYRLVQRIGLEDCTELLPLCTGDQIRTCLDLDGWLGDLPAIERLDPWLRALMVAGPEVLTERLLELDDELLNWLVLQSCSIHVISDPESFEPPDEEHVLTQDRRLCIVFHSPGERDLPTKVFLDSMMREAPDYCYNLLVFAGSALPTVLEEEALRWRQGRLADLGFVDPVEALGLYTAPRPDQLAEARRSAAPSAQSGALARRVEADERLAAALMALPPHLRDAVHQELIYVCNTALSADRIPLWDQDAQEVTLRRVRAGIGLGLDALSVGGAEADAEVLGRVPVALIFRTGYGRMLEAAEPARKARRRGLLAGPGGAIDAVDQALLRTWVAALTERHPTLPGDRIPRTARDLAQMRAFADVVRHLVDFPGGGRPDTAGLCAWIATQLTRGALGLEEAGPLPASRLAEAHRALFAQGALRDEARALLEARAAAGGLTDAPTLAFLTTWMAEELAGQAPEALEPRFVAAWVVGD